MAGADAQDLRQDEVIDATPEFEIRKSNIREIAPTPGSKEGKNVQGHRGQIRSLSESQDSLSFTEAMQKVDHIGTLRKLYELVKECNKSKLCRKKHRSDKIWFATLHPKAKSHNASRRLANAINRKREYLEDKRIAVENSGILPKLKVFKDIEELEDYADFLKETGLLEKVELGKNDWAVKEKEGVIGSEELAASVNLRKAELTVNDTRKKVKKSFRRNRRRQRKPQK